MSTEDVGITIRELVMEVREEMRELRKDFGYFKSEVVTRDELDTLQEMRRTSRRFMITTLVAILSVGIATIAVVMGVS